MSAVTTTTTTVPTTFQLGRQSLISSLFIGAGVGLAGWLFTKALLQFVIDPVFCQSPDTFSVCNNGSTIAWSVAHVIVALVSVFAMVRVNVYRPLLVVIAALISLWGLNLWLGPLEWPFEIMWQIILFALAYGLFAWLASVERFVVSVISTVVAVVLIRLLGQL